MSGPGRAGRSAVLGGLLALSVAGCANQVQPGGPHIQVVSGQPSSVVPAPTCPVTLPDPSTFPAVSTATLVPTGPVIATACAYGGLNDPHPGARGRTTKVTGSQLATLVGALNAGGSPPPGPVNCPNSTGRSDLIVFGYTGGGLVDVRVSVTGCPLGTNGHRMLAVSPDMVNQLNALVG
jgi:hypothetical protein